MIFLLFIAGLVAAFVASGGLATAGIVVASVTGVIMAVQALIAGTLIKKAWKDLK